MNEEEKLWNKVNAQPYQEGRMKLTPEARARVDIWMKEFMERIRHAQSLRPPQEKTETTNWLNKDHGAPWVDENGEPLTNYTDEDVKELQDRINSGKWPPTRE